MIATAHVIIGGTVGVLTQNPVLAFVAGVASHLFCDCVPHLDSPFKIEFKDDQLDQPIWSKKLMAFALADSVLAFLLTLYIWQRYYGLEFFSPYAWGALGAYLPDFIDVAPFWAKKLQKLSGFRQFHKIHLSTHLLWAKDFPMPKYWILGTVSQIVFVVPCLWFLL